MLPEKRILDMRSDTLLRSGVYADVFAVEDRAYKLFRSGPEIPPRQTREGRRRVFECQCEAFRIAAGDPWLCHHVARFYGIATIGDVLDKSGESVKSAYLLDCCYILELFGSEASEGKALAEWVRGQEYIQQALQRFSQIGIHALDSSVFHFDDPERFKFIDIELVDCY